ncbi:MAG: hypothetical protein JEY94_16955 [Melioribacteraceae bacterium]|nr:hypothetical protein [Melioribacteraceae bacterium]
MIFVVVSINAQDEFFEPTTTVGGYGELHYNYSKPEDGDSKKTLDFHRFVMFYSHTFSEKWSFNSEIELEHNFVKGEEKGELELEQAYINYHHSDVFGFQAGVILPSVGLINEYHEPPTFLGVERPEYNKYIIPTTWFGNGVAVYGKYKGFDYKLTVMEGLNAENFSAKSGIRDGRQKGYKSNAEDLLYNGRIDYHGIKGLKAGFSYTYNNATADSTNNAIGLLEVHAQYRANNIYADFEFGNISYDKGEVETSNGYYVDFGYNIGSLLNCKGEIIPFVRYTDYNTAASTVFGGDLEKQYHRTIVTVGVNIKPIDNIVFKADYSQYKIELGDEKTDLFNLGVGYMF